jgi:predicted DNA-binding transcriptional regulator AlpA
VKTKEVLGQLGINYDALYSLLKRKVIPRPKRVGTWAYDWTAADVERARPHAERIKAARIRRVAS